MIGGSIHDITALRSANCFWLQIEFIFLVFLKFKFLALIDTVITRGFPYIMSFHNYIVTC